MIPSRTAAALAAGFAALFLAAPDALALKPAQPTAPPQKSFERMVFTADEGAAARIGGIPEARFFADSVAEYDAALASAKVSGEPWLVLSGGGENGAFSAGILKGWTATGTRPDFAVVTGVSTGALIAPFAFAGPRYDRFLEEAYTGITAADVFEFGAKADSLVDSWPLKRLIERHVTPQLLADVAEEHRKGRASSSSPPTSMRSGPSRGISARSRRRVRRRPASSSATCSSPLQASPACSRRSRSRRRRTGGPCRSCTPTAAS